MPLRHEGFLAHKRYRYFKLAALMSVAAVIVYVVADFRPRANGGSWYGYGLGIISALLIIWLAMLGVRKRAITPGRWSLKGWTSAHVYLGLSLLVLATLHTGFQFGWNVHTLAYGLMVAVIASGAFGIYYYAVIPRRMSDNRAETSQREMIDEIAALDRDLLKTAQPLDQDYVREVKRAVRKTRITGGLLTRLSGTVRNCRTAAALRKLRNLTEKAPADQQAALSETISTLERKSAMLERARRHIQYRTLLELWLYVHVPLSIALLAALTAHIVSVFFYW